MTCAECRRYLDAFVDGELDARTNADLHDHLAGCPGCTRALEARRALGGMLRAPRFTAPPGLEARLERAARRAGGERPWRRLAGTGAVAAATAAVVALVVGTSTSFRRPPASADVTSEIVSAHVRALQADHMLDVASSDRHTVKPWFQGRVDFTVTPTDLATQGFVLAGGRMDYVAGQQVAALVYRKQLHFMNVLCWRAGAAPAAGDTTVRGFSVAGFSRGDLTCAVVADAASGEVGRLRDLLRAAPP